MTQTIIALAADEGTVVLFDAINEEGSPVTVAVDHRLAQPIVEALQEGELPQVDAEDWQVFTGRFTQ